MSEVFLKLKDISDADCKKMFVNIIHSLNDPNIRASMVQISLVISKFSFVIVDSFLIPSIPQVELELTNLSDENARVMLTSIVSNLSDDNPMKYLSVEFGRALDTEVKQLFMPKANEVESIKADFLNNVIFFGAVCTPEIAKLLNPNVAPLITSDFIRALSADSKSALSPAFVSKLSVSALVSYNSTETEEKQETQETSTTIQYITDLGTSVSDTTFIFGDGRPKIFRSYKTITPLGQPDQEPYDSDHTAITIDEKGEFNLEFRYTVPTSLAYIQLTLLSMFLLDETFTIIVSGLKKCDYRYTSTAYYGGFPEFIPLTCHVTKTKLHYPDGLEHRVRCTVVIDDRSLDRYEGYKITITRLPPNDTCGITGFTEGFHSALDTHKYLIETVSTQLIGIESNTSAVANDLNKLTSETAENKKQIGNVLTAMTDVPGKMTDVSGKITDVSGIMTDVSGKMTDVSGKINTLTTKTAENKDLIGTVLTAMTDVSGKINTITTTQTVDNTNEIKKIESLSDDLKLLQTLIYVVLAMCFIVCILCGIILYRKKI